MGLLLWFLLEVLFSGVLEFLFEVTKVFDSERDLRLPAVIWFLLIGLAGGLLTGVVAPDRVLDPGPFPGVSLVFVAILLGAGMQVWGALRSQQEKRISHLATWYGGAALGLGLAAGRLIVLAFIRDLRAV